ncbi:hypothetical protein F6T13_17715 [Escherichia coli]|nr:hypothetical protein [Escherichia coli]EGF7412306.1 hypothetical protein [Escherichia coli]EGF7453421.1 hypothetical protein [Escherichia coli]
MSEIYRQFEDWWSKYKSPFTEDDGLKEFAWVIWQASRAAIEITAPKFIDSREALAKGFTVDYSNGFGDAMDAYEENISAAGVKVKE